MAWSPFKIAFTLMSPNSVPQNILEIRWQEHEHASAWLLVLQNCGFTVFYPYSDTTTRKIYLQIKKIIFLLNKPHLMCELWTLKFLLSLHRVSLLYCTARSRGFTFLSHHKGYGDNGNFQSKSRMEISVGMLKERQAQRAAKKFNFFRFGSGKIYLIMNG